MLSPYIGKIKEISSLHFLYALISEFLATSMYMLIVCGACLPINGTLSLLHCALTTAFTIALLAHAFWDISGGHFNPVVSLAMAIKGNISIIRCVFYIVVQMAGSFAGTALLQAITPDDLEADLGALTVVKGVPATSGFLLELILTFFFIWVVHASTSEVRCCNGFQAPFAIGLSVGTSIMMAGGYHGCSLNPIRVLGPAVLADRLEHHWIYWVGPVLGSTAATIIFHLFTTEKYKNQKEAIKHHHVELDHKLDFKDGVTAKEDDRNGNLQITSSPSRQKNEGLNDD